MPWKECQKMDEKLRFVSRYLDGEKIAALCREFGISRVTGHKIIDRYRESGMEAFTDRSRRPYRQANRLPIRSATSVGERFHPTFPVPIDDLMASDPRYPELPTQGCDLLPVKIPGHEPQLLVHLLTLLPRHSESSSLCQTVKDVSGITCKLSVATHNGPFRSHRYNFCGAWVVGRADRHAANGRPA